jgi:hypothetical protein
MVADEIISTVPTILSDTKQLLGIGPDDTNFDLELIMHINSVITILTQLGVGPVEGLVIAAETEWPALISDRKDLEIIRSYIYLKVRLLFDPPQNSFLVKSIDDQCKEYEFRIEVQTTPAMTTTVDPYVDDYTPGEF